MTLTVWGRATSSNVQAVMWGLTELGLSAERIDLGGRHGGNDDPDFRNMNPMGLVPVLKDGEDAPIFESAAILRYLATRYGTEDFWPSDPSARAQKDKWAEFGKNEVCAAFTVPIFWGFYRTPEANRDTAAIARAIENFERWLGFLPAHMEQDFVTGQTISLADIWIGHVLYRYFTLDIPRNPPPYIQPYYERLTARPAYQTHVMVDYSELKATV